MVMVPAVGVVGNLSIKSPAAAEISFLAKSQHASRPRRADRWSAVTPCRNYGVD